MYSIQAQLRDGDNYIPTGRAVQIESVSVVANADAGATASVTVSDDTDTINVATCDGDTAGTVTAGIPDEMNGNLTVAAGGVIKLVCSSTNGVAFGCELIIDENLIGNR